MMLEAEALGADGIVGVRLQIQPMSLRGRRVGIHRNRHRRLSRGRRRRKMAHLTTAKAVHQLALRSGLLQELQGRLSPDSGLVMGNCVYHVAQLDHASSLQYRLAHIERTNFTDALYYAARELAQERMDLECEHLQAEGVDGVKIEQNHHWQGNGHVIEFFTIGTAVAPIEGREDTPVEEPHLVMTVDE